jgi:hypothetical protein
MSRLDMIITNDLLDEKKIQFFGILFCPVVCSLTWDLVILPRLVLNTWAQVIFLLEPPMCWIMNVCYYTYFFRTWFSNYAFWNFFLSFSSYVHQYCFWGHLFNRFLLSTCYVSWALEIQWSRFCLESIWLELLVNGVETLCNTWLRKSIEV